MTEDRSEISDGYHTFNELYEHRHVLWMALLHGLPLRIIDRVGIPWKSQKHSDGSSFEGWFISGLGVTRGEQMSYHLPIRLWDICPGVELESAPEFDGHTAAESLERIRVMFGLRKEPPCKS